LLKGQWKEDHPASPHRAFNAYIQNFTGFQPEGEVDNATLVLEPEIPPICTPGFPFEKIPKSMIFFLSIRRHHSPSIVPNFLDDLARAIYAYMTGGVWLRTSGTWKMLITHGIARYEKDSNSRIDEPLVLKSLLSWLLANGKSLQQDIRIHFDYDLRAPWERALVLGLTTLLKTPRRLEEIFQFKYSIPLHGSGTPLNDRRAKLIVGKDGSNYNIDIGSPSMWSLDVVLVATAVEMVGEWLEHGIQLWCKPPREMGPDLLSWLELDDGSRILLVITAKCRIDDGNVLDTATLADGIQSVTPSSFLKVRILFYVLAPSKSTISPI